MTAIIWKNGKLLVDSFVEKGGEWFDVSDKVLVTRRDMKLVSSDGQFEDDILGLTYTGARYPAERFGQALYQATVAMAESIPKMISVRVGDPDPIKYTYEALLARYEQADGLGLFNIENNFTVLMIGAKHAYKVDLTVSGGLEIERIHDNDIIYMGSGAPYMRDLDKRNEKKAEPIRMMHFAAVMEPGCGGRILQFERVPDDRMTCGLGLAMTGLYEEPDIAQRRAAEIAAKNPAAPDLIINPNAYNARRRRGENAGVSVDESDLETEPEKPEEVLKSEQQAERAAEVLRNQKIPAKRGDKRASKNPINKKPARRSTSTRSRK